MQRFISLHPDTDGLKTAFNREIRERCLPPFSVVITTHGKSGQSAGIPWWSFQVEKDNLLGLPYGGYEIPVERVVNAVKVELPWVRHIFLWACNKDGYVLKPIEGIVLHYAARDIGFGFTMSWQLKAVEG